MLLVVTGASRGFGRAIAKQLVQQVVATRTTREDADEKIEKEASGAESKNAQSSSSSKQVSNVTIILVARDTKGLQETSNIIFEELDQQQRESSCSSSSSSSSSNKKKRKLDHDNDKTTTSNPSTSTTTTTTTRKYDEYNAIVTVICHTMDLSNLEQLDTNLDTILQQVQLGYAGDEDDYNPSRHNYDSMILINNAGSIGHVGNIITSPSLQDMIQNVNLNITSSLWISTRFLRHVKSLNVASSSPDATSSKSKTQPITFIVNVSSLTAIAKFPSLGIYSAGKACRDKYHEIMATELESKTGEEANTNGSDDDDDDDDDGNKTYDDDDTTGTMNIKVINYAPGPLETQMVEEIRASKELHPTLKPSFHQPLLQPEQSATKLIKLLLSSLADSDAAINNTDDDDDKNKKSSSYYYKFESGDHIDYYDLP